MSADLVGRLQGVKADRPVPPVRGVERAAEETDAGHDANG
jgi:hypothetical protein